MKILGSSLAFHPCSPREALRELSAMEFEGMEFLCEPPWHPAAWSAESCRALRKLAKDTGFSISLHAPVADVNLMSPHPAARALAEEELYRCLELAADIGADSVTFHLGYRPLMGAPFAPPWGQAQEAIRRLGATGQDLGVKLCLENDPKFPGVYLWDLTRWHELVLDLPVLGTLDLGHAWTAYREKAFELIPPLLPLVHTVHLHDNRGDRDEHLGLGEGTLDLGRARPLLTEVPVVVLEVKSPAGLKRSLELLRRL